MFHVNGTVSTQKHRFWCQENPKWVLEAHSQRRKKVNVWTGIINDNRNSGSYLFDSNLTTKRYLDFRRF